MKGIDRVIRGVSKALVAVMIVAAFGGAEAAGERGEAVPGQATQPGTSGVRTTNSGGPLSLGEIPAWQARLELARTLMILKRYEESLAEFRKVLKVKPDLTAARIEMAKVLYWTGRPREALAELSAVPAGLLGDPEMLLLADLYRIEKRYEEARPLYTGYLKGHPDDQAARLRLAEMLSWMKQYEASLAEYEKILAARPDDIQVRRRYAQVLIWASRYDEAVRELRKTLR
ncbi:MAG: tetratricopeptide repeat protein [Deltaproteobacteria bacterium]|nr:tetratricopeptide repeat protein [Deltaproteobacteria bacterium]